MYIPIEKLFQWCTSSKSEEWLREWRTRFPQEDSGNYERRATIKTIEDAESGKPVFQVELYDRDDEPLKSLIYTNQTIHEVEQRILEKIIRFDINELNEQIQESQVCIDTLNEELKLHGIEK